MGENLGTSEFNIYTFVGNDGVTWWDVLGLAKPLGPLPPSMSPKNRSVEIINGEKSLHDGELGYSITLRHGIPSGLDTIQKTFILTTARFRTDVIHTSGVWIVDNFSWKFVKEGMVDGRGYLDDAFQTNFEIGLALSFDAGQLYTDLCEVVSNNTSEVGTATAKTINDVLNPLFPTVPPERQIINLPDIPIPFNQTGQVASDRIDQALGEPKISFGLVVTWIKGEKGQPNKETYEVSGSLKK
jgi:hypothetical protein